LTTKQDAERLLMRTTTETLGTVRTPLSPHLPYTQGTYTPTSPENIESWRTRSSARECCAFL